MILSLISSRHDSLDQMITSAIFYLHYEIAHNIMLMQILILISIYQRIFFKSAKNILN